MYQGFYNLVSGMLTQSRNLNVISNNMVNVQTPGYKSDTMVASTFQEELMYRTGRRDKSEREDLATVSKISTASRTYVNYEAGAFNPTGGVYDFAINGDGFFCIQTEDGVRYTRNGSFAVDEEGYLVLNDLGRVLSTDGQPIQINSEEFTVDRSGHIVAQIAVGTGGNMEVRDFGTLRVVDFDDYDELQRQDNGLFSTNQAARQVNTDETTIVWQTLERSNVDMVEEMTSMMTSQRALQSAAQMLRMYDSIMSKSVTDVGRL